MEAIRRRVADWIVKWLAGYPLAATLVAALGGAGGGLGIWHHIEVRANSLKKDEVISAIKESPYYKMITSCEITAHGECLDEFYHKFEDALAKQSVNIMDKAELIESLRLELNAIQNGRKVSSPQDSED